MDSHLKEQGIVVVHVISNEKFAKKAVAAGVDAIVAEGFEAGGHNGIEETTMCLVPHIRKVVDVPLIVAGGIDGKSHASRHGIGRRWRTNRKSIYCYTRVISASTFQGIYFTFQRWRHTIDAQRNNASSIVEESFFSTDNSGL